MTQHKWKPTSYTSQSVSLRCKKCLRQETVEFGEEARALYLKQREESDSKHDALRSFGDTFIEGGDFVGDDYQPVRWKLTDGFLIDEIQEWGKEFPEKVQLIHVDDSYHSSSLLVLIESKNEKKFMGTTVYFIPQNAPLGPPSPFFLYPGASFALAAALTKNNLEAYVRQNVLVDYFEEEDLFDLVDYPEGECDERQKDE